MKTDLSNVQEYGAEGNGKTDDTRTRTKAIDAASTEDGRIVLIPDGEYRITEDTRQTASPLWNTGNMRRRQSDQASRSRHDFHCSLRLSWNGGSGDTIAR
ncbi:MAG: hypothetical protein CMM07_22360 [Rhodopirellula sp.]|nr:hypothetical protein [Rhodopirellula sp.]